MATAAVDFRRHRVTHSGSKDGAVDDRHAYAQGLIHVAAAKDALMTHLERVASTRRRELARVARCTFELARSLVSAPRTGSVFPLKREKEDREQ